MICGFGLRWFTSSDELCVVSVETGVLLTVLSHTPFILNSIFEWRALTSASVSISCVPGHVLFFPLAPIYSFCRRLFGIRVQRSLFPQQLSWVSLIVLWLLPRVSVFPVQTPGTRYEWTPGRRCLPQDRSFALHSCIISASLCPICVREDGDGSVQGGR